MAAFVVKEKTPVVIDRTPEYDEKVKEKKAKLVEAGVRYVFGAWVDINGRTKAKFVPVDRFEKLAYASEMYTAQAFEVMGPLGPHDDDQAALPDIDSLTICPWDRQYAWMAADLYWHGEPYPFCSRTILKRAIKTAAEQGYKMMLGIEPEFYILRDNPSGGVAPFHPADVGPSWGYDVESTLDSMPILSRIQEHLDELGWDVSCFDHEGGHSQYEFDFGFTDVLQMSDRFTFLRLMLKEVAKQFGAFVTYMPKPFANDFRSGAHLNMSIVDAASGGNLMRRADDPRGMGLSEDAYHFIGGLLKHAPALTAVSCPTVNGYKGFVPGGIDFAAGVARDWSWAPTYVAYGDNNRSVMFRVPNGRDCVENRVPDISMNVYWTAAMHLAAGVEGIRERIDPGEPLNENAYKLSAEDLQSRNVTLLPATLGDALNAFEKDDLPLQVLGADPRKEYLAFKREEYTRYTRHVSDWELETYMKFF